MRIHVVKSEVSWILNRVSRRVQEHMPNCTVGLDPVSNADINFYVSYQGFIDRVSGTLNVPWMTHLPAQIDDGGWRRAKFRRAAELGDYCIAMSQNTANHCPKHKTRVWGGGVDSHFHKPTLVLGVAARISRRKRPDRIEALQTLSGVEVRVSHGQIPHAELPQWFRSLDYLVVTSDTEGGPYSVPEALAAGTPVIAPDVGWCWDYPVIRYDGTTEGLLQTVKAMRPGENSWQQSVSELKRLFAEMLGGT